MAPFAGRGSKSLMPYSGPQMGGMPPGAYMQAGGYGMPPGGDGGVMVHLAGPAGGTAPRGHWAGSYV